ncbi:hypothetical protein EDB67_10923 [Vibrio crassostreae]|nr:hypothetical protein EDB67_10923 [Vibrio crassostreae]
MLGGMKKFTIPVLVAKVEKGQTYQQDAMRKKLQRENAAQQKTRNEANRKKSYIAYKGSTFVGNKIKIQLLDFKDQKITFSVKNLTKSKTLPVKLERCLMVESKFGGQECSLIINGIGLSDNYGNQYRVRSSFDNFTQWIHPNETNTFKIITDRTLESSNLKLVIPTRVFGESAIIKFPSGF